MTTTPTSGAADLPEALIHAGMQALLQCTASELENLSPTLFEGYAGDVQRVFVAMTGKALSAALSAGQATAAPAQPAAQQGVAYAELPNFDDGEEPIWNAIFSWKNAERGSDAAKKAMKIESAIADQLRAFADATHTLRASHGQAPATVPPDSVQEDAALWHWLAEYLVGTRTDLDDEIVASETVNDLRKIVEAARKQGASHDR